MPLFKTIQFNATTQILVWKISESYEELVDAIILDWGPDKGLPAIILNEKNSIRLAGMKSEIHQRAFLSVRKLMQHAGFTDFDLYYDEFGKPNLYREKHISITHSHHFSAIIISDQTVGIDIELQREKIIKIAHKFCESEFEFLPEEFDAESKQEYIRKLTVIWGAKESIFKIRNEKGISFKDHIKANAFELEDKQAIAELHFENLIKDFKIHFEEIEGFTLVYAFQIS